MHVRGKGLTHRAGTHAPWFPCQLAFGKRASHHRDHSRWHCQPSDFCLHSLLQIFIYTKILRLKFEATWLFELWLLAALCTIARQEYKMALYADKWIFFPTFPYISDCIWSLTEVPTDKALCMLWKKRQGFGQHDSFTCFCNKFCCCRGEKQAISSGSRQDEMSHTRKWVTAQGGQGSSREKRQQKIKACYSSGASWRGGDASWGQTYHGTRRTQYHHATDVWSHFKQ